MNVELSQDLEEIVQNKIRSGIYHSTDDVLRQALRVLDERDQFLELQKQTMRAQISQGLESLRKGDSYDTDEVFDEIEAELDRRETN